MLAHERQAELQRLLAEQGTVLVSELAKAWDVSEMTVRRDLKTLEDQGVVSRVHGGAVAGGALRWRSRIDQHRPEKLRAAAKLAALLPESGCIYLDGSTTIFHLAEHLEQVSGLVVVTNNIDTLQRLEHYPGIEAVLVGGRLNRATDNLVGPLARRCLEQLAFAAAFFSAYGCDAEVGCTEPALEDAELKAWVCERSTAIRVALNHQKLGTRAAGVWRPPPERSLLATDLDADDARLAPYRTGYAAII